MVNVQPFLLSLLPAIGNPGSMCYIGWSNIWKMWCELFLTSDIFGWNISSKNGDIYRSWTTLTNKSHDIYIFGSMLQCPHGNKIPTQKCIPWFCTLSILSVLWTWDSGHVNNKVPFWVSGVLKMYSGSLSLGLRSFRCSKHKWTHHSCASWAFSTQLKSVNLSKSSQRFGPCQLMKASHHLPSLPEFTRVGYPISSFNYA
jgi:hypothetical protein